MNVIFVNYGDFTTNSLNHIAAFAAGLGEAGHASIVAVPWGIETLRVIHQPRFRAATFADLLERDVRFPDGRHADVVHAWTPREGVRRFVVAYQRRAHARVIVHLEDNEDHLFAARHSLDPTTLLDLPETTLSPLVDEVLTHPRRARQFLRVSDGATVITPALARFLPPSIPRITLYPGIDPALFGSTVSTSEARRILGLDDAGCIIAYPGSSNFANESEMRDLYAAVALLNERGIATRLVRTGKDSDVFAASVPADHRRHIVHLGFIDRARIPILLAAADVLVQPGAPGPYNDFRLPSKVPEFLYSGKPVVLPAANVGLQLRHGLEAWIVPDGRAETLATACEMILRDGALSATLSSNAAQFARAHFDLGRQCSALADFYTRILTEPPRPGSLSTINDFETEVSLSLKRLLHELRTASTAPECASHMAELVPLIEQLERPDAGQMEKERVERERDTWRANFDRTRDHLQNVEEHLAAKSAHATHLEAERSTATAHIDHLEAENATAGAHVKNLENQVAATAQHIRNLDDQIKVLRSENSASTQRIAWLQAEKHTLESARDTAEALVAQLSERASRLSITIHDLKLEILRRNAKMQTLESSFSWRLTQPLRWLRRRFIDPRRLKAAAGVAPTLAEIAPPAPPCSPPGLYGLPFSVDEPRSWTLPPRKHLLRGWVFHPDGNELRGIRAVVGGRIIEGVYGFKRLDVAASVRGKPQAEFCGWRIEADFQDQDTRLEIQALEESGIWLPFFRTILRVGADLGDADLTRYEEWIRVYDSISAATLRSQRNRAGHFSPCPRISILMPVFNTPERWLRRAIDSVRGQSFPDWELCIANDASTEPHIRKVLDDAAAADPRIKVVHRASNGHISAASNSALELASGDFLALLDHDDELAPNALFEVALTLGQHPDADLVYSDEDKIDEDGRRFEPYFKPDWNPDLFLGQNYLSHLSVYRSALVREAGGFRLGFEGSQDWDLALRVTDRSAADRIIHIPRVLYHWRAIAGSTALQLSEKSYPVEAARRALADHFARKSMAAKLEPVPGDHWRVVFSVPKPAPLVSIVIPTRNGLEHLQRCIESIRTKTDYPDYEIIIVDNQSDDPATIEWLHRASGDSIRVLSYPRKFNYSAINNAAVAAAAGSVVALLNNDLEVINPGWLSEMVAQACRDEIGCVGAMLYYPNNVIQHAGVILGIGGVAGHAFRDFPRGSEGSFNRARLVQNYSAVTAACLVVRKAIYEQVGGLDETDLAVAFNDIDFCLKVRRAGYWNLWTPFAELYHHESASRGADDTPEKRSRFDREIEVMLRRWGPDLTADPAYNPNLTLEHNDFSLAIPPRPAPARVPLRREILVQHQEAPTAPA